MWKLYPIHHRQRWKGNNFWWIVPHPALLINRLRVIVIKRTIIFDHPLFDRHFFCFHRMEVDKMKWIWNLRYNFSDAKSFDAM